MSGGSPAAGRPSYRHDDGVGDSRHDRAASRALRTSSGWARIERAWWLVLGGAMLVFSAFPIANLVLGYATKDYGLWYQVGLAVRLGLDVYPRPETRAALSLHVSPLRRGDARLGQHAGAHRVRCWRSCS